MLSGSDWITDVDTAITNIVLLTERTGGIVVVKFVGILIPQRLVEIHEDIAVSFVTPTPAKNIITTAGDRAGNLPHGVYVSLGHNCVVISEPTARVKPREGDSMIKTEAGDSLSLPVNIRHVVSCRCAGSEVRDDTGQSVAVFPLTLLPL